MYDRSVIPLVLSCALLASCEVLGPAEPASFDYEILTPSRVGADGLIPAVVLRLDARDSIDVDFTGEVRFVDEAGQFGPRPTTIHHGVAGVSVVLQEPSSMTLRIAGDAARRPVEFRPDQPVVEVSGALVGTEVVWTKDADVLITADLVVPEGTRLVVEADTRVLLRPAVNLFVRGSMEIRGDRSRPVLFAGATTDAPWGGVVVEEGSLEAHYAFFVNGGGDPSRAFGHSDAQAVLMFESAEAYLQHVFLLDNTGKALGGQYSRIRFDRGLITRCDTGGEVWWGVTHLSNSHILEIPNGNGALVDDDNDGFYFYDALPETDEPSRVENMFVIDGRDDAVDHNQARLEISGSWLEGFDHECVAGSSANYVRVSDTVVKGCEQGIEAGYGAPNVIVDHVVITENDVGIRFGDSYQNDLEGHITVTNAILFENGDDVRNLDLSTGAPVPDAIDISFSILDDPEFDGCPGCLRVTPRFDARYHLLPGSPGIGAGMNGSNMGLSGSAD